MTRRTAIVLAGGKGRRFQIENEIWQDKALAKLFGKPLLVHAVENVGTVVDEIIVCVNDGIRKIRYSELLDQYGINNIRFLVDEKVDDLGGPIVAILTGLKSAKADYCLTLPCDTPLLQPKVADFLLEKAEENDVVVPMWPDGRLETLMITCTKSCIFEITDILCHLDRSRSDDIFRGASAVYFVSPIAELRDLDPELRSFVNINIRNDLIQLQTRQINGHLVESLSIKSPSLNLHELQLLREASELENKGEFAEASKLYSSCSEILEKAESHFWAAISREKEGKNLIGWAKCQDDQKTLEKAMKIGEAAILKAARNYALEAEVHEAHQLLFLARRARDDKLWCESRTHEKP